MVELAKYFDDLTNSEKVVFNYIYIIIKKK